MVSLKSLLKNYGKVITLLLMMALGALLPQFHIFSFLIQYLLMVMLFFAFLDMDIHPQSFQKGVVWVLLANLGIAFLGYWLVSFFDINLALAAFMTAIAPTVIASPVIISFIEGRVEYRVASVLLTNISMALVVPVALPFLVGATVHISILEVLQPVLIVMFVPLILVRLAMRLPKKAQALGQKNNSFVIWIALTFINPLVAMGPTFYVLYNNLYNSWQIYLFEKRRNHV